MCVVSVVCSRWRGRWAWTTVSRWRTVILKFSSHQTQLSWMWVTFPSAPAVSSVTAVTVIASRICHSPVLAVQLLWGLLQFCSIKITWIFCLLLLQGYVSSWHCLQLYFLLQTIHLKSSGDHVSARMQFVKYGARVGKERSGAYLFLPDGAAKVSSSIT